MRAINLTTIFAIFCVILFTESFPLEDDNDENNFGMMDEVKEEKPIDNLEMTDEVNKDEDKPIDNFGMSDEIKEDKPIDNLVMPYEVNEEKPIENLRMSDEVKEEKPIDNLSLNVDEAQLRDRRMASSIY